MKRNNSSPDGRNLKFKIITNSFKYRILVKKLFRWKILGSTEYNYRYSSFTPSEFDNVIDATEFIKKHYGTCYEIIYDWRPV